LGSEASQGGAGEMYFVMGLPNFQAWNVGLKDPENKLGIVQEGCPCGKCGML
jgi:hypothetical protein